jgi:hypothetical protein
MAVRLSASRADRPLPPRKIPGTHFCQRLSRPQGLCAAGKIWSIEKIHLIGTRTRDLPAYSIVPQQTTVPRSPGDQLGNTSLYGRRILKLIFNRMSGCEVDSCVPGQILVAEFCE